MRSSLCICLIFFCFVSLSQTAWKAVYSDSALTVIPDSMVKSMADDMRVQNTPDEIIELVLAKMKSGPVTKTRTRYVTANDDSTLIDIEVAEEGSLRIEFFEDEHRLLKQDKLYLMTGTGNYDSLYTAGRVFKPTGRQPVFFNYTCREYTSTDSACTIWVSEDLPSCINPGIVTGNIKGAVLFYELKLNPLVLVRCGIRKLEKIARGNTKI